MIIEYKFPTQCLLDRVLAVIGLERKFRLRPSDLTAYTIQRSHDYIIIHLKAWGVRCKRKRT